jgi:glycosyltransferase involved in cell wall biosynthesis
MIFFDTTKSGAATHRSGLTRVNARLRHELGNAAVETVWDSSTRRLKSADSRSPGKDDWFLTTELFSDDERSGLRAFMAARPCRLAAIFHDAIPLKHPHITWPQSVARHPAYMKLLAEFDRVWAVSHASKAELLTFWTWQGIVNPPPVEVLTLGADFNAAPRIRIRDTNNSTRAKLLCLGIVEPRKNQGFLLDVCEALWIEGMEFELHLVGRVNPHFGKPIVQRIQSLRRTRGSSLYFHEAASDAIVADLYHTARATVFPTRAEGCGLPLLESLWMGVPCVCSDLPVLRENADGGGCLPLALNDSAAWKTGLRRVLTDTVLVGELTAQATTRALPTWKDASQTLASALV